jgi:hypothetical protein
VSTQEHWDALAALLKASNLGDDVYDYGQVPGADGNDGVMPTAFVLLHIDRRYVPPTRAGGTDRTGYRASVRFVGTTAHNARVIGGWVNDAFEVTPGRGKRITVGGVDSTPLTHESTTAVESDDGRYSGLVAYTYAL